MLIIKFLTDIPLGFTENFVVVYLENVMTQGKRIYRWLNMQRLYVHILKFYRRDKQQYNEMQILVEIKAFCGLRAFSVVYFVFLWS